jgi:hypothetical protein
MGLMDVYSAINAGGVGRYGASDAANGGAPGTVADKVNNQMSAHRQNAIEMFGGMSAPQTPDFNPNLAPDFGLDALFATATPEQPRAQQREDKGEAEKQRRAALFNAVPGLG